MSSLHVAERKRKGDLAELKVAADLLERGHAIAFPYGEDSNYDLIVDRDGCLERVQVKYVHGNPNVVEARCKSHSLTKFRVVKRYTAEMMTGSPYHRPSDRC